MSEISYSIISPLLNSLLKSTFIIIKGELDFLNLNNFTFYFFKFIHITPFFYLVEIRTKQPFLILDTLLLIFILRE